MRLWTNIFTLKTITNVLAELAIEHSTHRKCLSHSHWRNSENFDFTRMLIMSAIDALPLTLLSLSLCAPRIDSQKLSEELAIKLCNFSNLTYVHMYLVDK